MSKNNIASLYPPILISELVPLINTLEDPFGGGKKFSYSLWGVLINDVMQVGMTLVVSLV